jgi:hypothetical protein
MWHTIQIVIISWHIRQMTIIFEYRFNLIIITFTLSTSHLSVTAGWSKHGSLCLLEHTTTAKLFLHTKHLVIINTRHRKQTVVMFR